MMTLIRLTLALLLLATPALAEKIPLAEISRYLNGLTTAEAGFRQINWDGSESSGRVFIQRPGRMRFEYAAPERTLVLASGGQVAVFDSKSNQPPEQYPLKRTPLNLILARKVDLGQAKMVVGHSEEGALTIVTAQDPENPEYGTLQLAFSANPVTLRQWIVTDESGSQTRVILEPFRVGESYKSSLFSIPYEADRRKRRRN
jgi:outer membrane lipoprotein-sorting protein